MLEPGASPIELAYHDDHLRKRITYPNGITQCFWYDVSDRIRDAWSQRDSTCPSTPPADRITGYAYEYAEAGADTGLIQKVTDRAGNVTIYDYDDLNRLQLAQTTGPNAKTFAYSYDHNSNRLTETVDGGQPTAYDYSNNADQLESAGSTTFSYDGNGNELTASGRRSATYNAKDQLDSLTPQGQSAIAMSYTDAGQFDRVTRGSTSFTNSALGLTRENTTSYTTDPEGFVLGQRTPTRTYFLHDGLGSVVATTNEAGQESLIARYAPFGTCLANCPAVPYRWLGGLGVYWDEPLQLHKMGTRYYDPALGRFTQVDPVEGGSANAYDYARQDPTNTFDPNGQFGTQAQFLDGGGRASMQPRLRRNWRKVGAGIFFTSAGSAAIWHGFNVLKHCRDQVPTGSGYELACLHGILSAVLGATSAGGGAVITCEGYNKDRKCWRPPRKRAAL